jgi:hypothetical protein
MGKEYRTDNDIEFDSVEDWIARADAIPEALETAVRKKIVMAFASDKLGLSKDLEKAGS